MALKARPVAVDSNHTEIRERSAVASNSQDHKAVSSAAKVVSNAVRVPSKAGSAAKAVSNNATKATVRETRNVSREWVKAAVNAAARRNRVTSALARPPIWRMRAS